MALSPGGQVMPATVSFLVSHRSLRRFSEGSITLRGEGRPVTLRSDLLLPESIPGGRYVRLARPPDRFPAMAGGGAPA
jgi:hypothetical protein